MTTRQMCLALVAAAAVCLSASAEETYKLQPARSAADVPLETLSEPMQRLMRTRSSAGSIVGAIPGRSNSASPVKAEMPKVDSPVFAAKPELAKSASEMFGCVLFNDDWADYSQIGVYQFPAASPSSLTPIRLSASFNANGGATMTPDGYVVSYLTNEYGTPMVFNGLFDAETLNRISITQGAYESLATDLTYDVTTDKVYGCFLTSDGKAYEFGTIEPTNGWKRTTICALTEGFESIAADPADGTIYAITLKGILVKVDKTTGAQTRVGDTKVKSDMMVSAMIDPRTGVFYRTVATMAGAGQLYTVDKTNGACTLIYNFPGNSEVNGVFAKAPATEPDAPAAVKDLKVTFTDDSLTGSVSFKAPSLHFNNTPILGAENLTYTVSVDGEVASTGKITKGVVMELDVTVAETGMHTISARVSNDEGPGPESSVTLWVGEDTPALVENVRLTATNGVMALTWDAVDSSMHAGWVDPSQITYTVTRMADNSVVATGLVQNSFSETLTVPSDHAEAHRYSVSAQFRSNVSEPVLSNIAIIGHEQMPYSETFDTEDRMDLFTIIDADNDDHTWYWTDYTFGDNGLARTKYSSMNSGERNDWIMTPPLYLEANKTYNLTFKAMSFADNIPEQFEVFLATGPSVEDVDIAVMPRTSVKSSKLLPFKASMSVESTGEYYLAFRHCTDPQRWEMSIDDIMVGEGMSDAAPAAPEISVTPDPDGNLSASVNVTMPVKTLGGEDLGSLTKAELYRDDVLIQTWNNPRSGAKLIFTDGTPENGRHTYKALAYNSVGRGQEVETEVYVGINVPKSPASAGVKETETPGTVEIFWTAPESDREGNPLNPNTVDYCVYGYDANGQRVIIKDGFKGTSLTYKVCEPDHDQVFVEFYITAHTIAGTSSSTATPLIPIGKAYSMPWRLSAKDGKADGALFQENVTSYAEATYWAIAVDGVTFSDCRSSDEDGGFFYMYGTFPRDRARLHTGKVGVTKPDTKLTFRYFTNQKPNKNEITVYAKDGEGNLTELTTVIQEGDEDTPASTWQRAVVDLSAYYGKTISFVFEGYVIDRTTCMLDDVRVTTLADHDLTLCSFEVPEYAMPDTPFGINIDVENNGTEVAKGWSVRVMRDGEEIACKAGDALESGQRVKVQGITDSHSLLGEENHTYRAEIVFAADANPDDNMIDGVKSRIVYPALPYVTDLSGSSNGTGAILNWTEPELNNGTGYVTEDFEDPDYEEFTVSNFGPWMMYDGNGSGTYVIATGVDSYLEYPNAGAPMAFQLFNPVTLNIANIGWNTHSGNRMLAAFANAKGRNDGWLISPRLSVSSQTISFFARAVSQQYGLEEFEVLYSTNDRNPESFVKAQVDGYTGGVGTEWTKFEVLLPEDAKFFAIRCISFDKFCLLIDDITYSPYGSSAEDLSLVGYNVWRNGVRINADRPVEECSYVDREAPLGVEHEYRVTTVYSDGESRPSNSVSINPSSVQGIMMESTEGEQMFDVLGCPVKDAQPGQVILHRRGNKVTKTLGR